MRIYYCVPNVYAGARFEVCVHPYIPYMKKVRWAETCAEDLWKNRNGMEYSWPLTLNLYWKKEDATPFCVAEVEIESVPLFKATLKGGGG